MPERVVITSFGIISSLGNSPDDIVESLKQQRVSFERISFDPDVAVSPVSDFELKDYTGRFKDSRYLTRGTSFAVAAAMNAVATSCLDEHTLEQCGLFAGSGPNLDITGEFSDIRNNEIVTDDLAALWILKFLPNTVTSAISKLTGIHGENITMGSACSASLMAIGEAYRKIRDGYHLTALAGGGDSRLSPGGIHAYKKAQALWYGDNDPAVGYVPFGRERTGFIPGEGGAFFLLEQLEHAEKRGAPILAEISGYGASMDGYKMTAPRPDGKWAAKAVSGALKEAGISPADVDLISSHGTGTVLNDMAEAALIEQLFDNHPVRVMAMKSWIGHIASACGAVELGICLSCLKHGYWPEIRNLDRVCNSGINFLKTPEYSNPDVILLENFGFGGQNTALVVKRWNEQ